MYTNKLSKTHILIICACCGMMACTFGIDLNAYGVFLSPLAASFNASSSAAALHVTLYGLAKGFSSPFIVAFINKHSDKYKIVMYVCMTVYCLVYILNCFCTNLFCLDVLAIVKGVSSVGFFMSTVTVLINNWFISCRGIISGLCVAFSGVAGAVFSPVFTFVISRFGYKSAYVVCSIIAFLMTIPFNSVISFTPEELNLLPFYNGKNDTEYKAQNIIEFKIQSPVFLSVLFFASFGTIGAGIVSFLPKFSELRGFGAEFGAGLLSAAMIGNTISKLIFGYCSDKIGGGKTNFFVALICVLSLALLITTKNPFVLITGAFFFGFNYSITTIGVSTLSIDFFGQEQYKKAFPIISAANCIMSSLAITIVSLIVDLTNSVQIVLIVGIAISFIIAMLSFILIKKENKTTQR